jgi:nicotinate-nucleotide adenylyltransferase
LRLGLFGGSFDPFHLGHFLIARAARESFRLQEVVFIPCAHSPLKKLRPVAGDRARLRMLQRGLQGQDWARVSSWEISRRKISYTVETARAWAAQSPRAALYWIMGSDQWEALPSWKDPEELKARLRFLVFPRPGKPRPRRGFWMREIPLRIDISATEIRQRLRNKLSIDGLVLPSVQKMIRESRWYR